MNLPGVPSTDQGDRRRFDAAIRVGMLALEKQIASLQTASSNTGSDFSSQIASILNRLKKLEAALAALQLGTLFVKGIAGEALPGVTPVMAGDDGLFYVADMDDPDQAESFVGFTDRDYSAGTEATVQFTGAIENEDWTWDPQGRIYLGSDGALTQTKPTSGRILTVGFALTATMLLIAPELLTVQVRAADGAAVAQTRADGVISPTITVGFTNVIPATGMLVPDDMTQPYTELQVNGEWTIEGEAYSL